MEPPVMTSREITMPAWTFSALRDELGKISDKHSSTTLLQKVGYRSGISSSAVFKEGLNSAVLETMQSTFWTHLCDFFSCRGWGTLVVDSDHPGLGFLTSNDWAEAMTAEVDRNASCCFSTGFISGLLSEIVGSPVAVLESKCRARGDRACEFAFGAEQAVRELYSQLIVEAGPSTT
jgi:hypothetical protein